MDTLTVVGILTGLLFLIGLVGSLVPWIPGPLFILAGALLWAVATGFTVVGAGRLAILAALAGLTFVSHLATGALGAQRSGGSRWAVVGAVAGAVIGLSFGPLGLLAGPVVGAALAELLRSGDLEGSLRSGVGAFIGTLAGLLADFVIALAMVALFAWWVWRG
ncbi:MAG TPA: DUF456 domain-containing protein [Calidithermus sp.]|nr:DUF456 domain-containing protein [Calidithermus sp.]